MPESAEQAVLSAGAPADCPSNLPVSLTTFVEREWERGQVGRLLARGRLLTLTGAGGIGKTRLALEIAEELRAGYADGVWLMELASLADPAFVPHAVAAVLRVGEAAGQSLLARLVADLRGRRLLLVLDNCEHLASACAELADRLLWECPGLQILATSREPLGVPGEIVWRVPALGLPDPRVALGTDELAGSEAVGLFVDRARSALPGFALGDCNAAAVAEICRRLDGIPLAIELAAARVSVLSPDQILGRLDDRFRLVVGGCRTAPSRQQTLRATLDWSLLLLAERERVVFRRAAVFAGWWTLEAVEAVCAFSAGSRGGRREPEGGDASPAADFRPLVPGDVLEIVGRLVDKSLVLADTQPGEARHRLLETVRQYGLEQLAEHGEAEVIRRRHLERYLELAARAGVHCEESLAVFRAIGDKQGIGYALSNRGHVARLRGEHAHARAFLEQALAICRELEDNPFIGRTLCNLGTLALVEGDAARAGSMLDEALWVLREVESRCLCLGLCLCGILAVQRGEYARGARLAGAAARHPDELRNPDAALATARAALGDTAFAAAWSAGESLTLEQAVECALEERPAPASRRTGDAQSAAPARVCRSVAALSSREWEVAALIARGLTNRQIAEALVITERTAEAHVTHVLGKLGLRSRAQIAVRAVEHGLVAAPST